MSFLPRSLWLPATLLLLTLATACSEPVPPRKVASVALTPATLTLAKGTHGKLAATATYNDKTTEDVTARATWTVSDAALATVAAGEVNATAAGQGEVKAAVDGIAGSAALTVTAAELTALELTPPAAGLAKGTTATLKATGTFSDGSKQDLTGEVAWAAGDATIASVAGGVVTGVAPGSTTIHADKGGIGADATIVVTDAKLVSLAVNPSTASLAKGTRTTLSAIGTFTDGSIQDLTSLAAWVSADPAIAAIDGKGLLHGVSEGEVAITAGIGETTAHATVQVTAAALEAVALDPPALALAKGTNGAFRLSARFSDGSTQDVTEEATWGSDDPLTAAVSPAEGTRGQVAALAVGRAHVTASFGGKDAQAAVEVSAATLVSLAIDPPAPALANGTTLALSATGLFTDGSTQNLTSAVTWAVSDEDVVHVSNAAGTSGLATALAEGTAEVTAQLGTVKASASLEVTAATLATIVLSPGALALPMGTADELVATGVFSDGTRQELTDQVTWASADETVAAVSNAAGGHGQVTALAEGTTTITATRGTIVGRAAVAVSSARLVSLVVSPAAPAVPQGRTLALTAIGTYSDGTTRNVTSAAAWTASPEATATVSNADGSVGTLTALAAGTVTVTAQVGNVSGAAQIEVTSAVLVSIALTPQPAALAKGTTLALTATGTWSDGTTTEITEDASWSSSDTALAAVSNADGQKGLVSGLSAGSVTIEARLDDKTGSAPVTVTAARLTGLSLSPATLALAKGTSAALTLTGTFSDGSHQNLTTLAAFSSSGPAASVSNADGAVGQVSALAVGSATLTATFGGKSATAQVDVSAAQLVSIAISPSALTVAQGTSSRLLATGTFSDGSTQDLTAGASWSSDDAAVATVSMVAGERGLVTGVGRGNTTIHAKSGTIEGLAKVSVSAGVLDHLEVTAAASSFAKGTTEPLTATGVFTDGTTQNLTSGASWTSSDAAIVSVSNASGSTGLASALATGTATITASFGGKSAQVELTATAATLVSVGVSPVAPVLAKGTSRRLAATGAYSDRTTQDLTTQVTWTSADPAVATVSTAGGAEGTISAAGEGSTAISAQLGTVTGSATVTVTAATLVSIGVTPLAPTLAAGAKLAFVATGTFSDGSRQDLSSVVTWSSSDASVLDVSNAAGSRGLGSAGSPGNVVVKATSGAISGSTTVTVTSATLQSIAISPAQASLAKGTVRQLTVTGIYTDGTVEDLSATVSWSSDDPLIATVSNASASRGQLRGAGIGATRVIATAGSITGSINVTVTAALLSSIDVTPALPTLAKGLTKGLVATGTYTDGTRLDLTDGATWASADPAIVDVSNGADDKGTATALGVGSAQVTATVGSVTGGTKVTVTAATLVSLAVGPAKPSLAKGLTLQLSATGLYTDGTKADLTKDATWASDAPAVADVSSAADSAGLASALDLGNATISATVQGISASVPFTVTAAELTSLSITPATTSLAKGTTRQLVATGVFTDASHLDLTASVTWSASANLDVSNAAEMQGIVTALSLGEGTVTARLGSIAADATITVTAAQLKQISLAPATASLPRGTSTRLVATGLYTDGTSADLTTQATWGSDATTVAAVSSAAGSEGLVTAQGLGRASISATVGTVVGTATVDVTAAVLSRLEVSPTAPSLPVGHSQRMVATGVYSDGTTKDLTASASWSTGDPAIATVSNSAGTEGTLTGAGVGATGLTVTFGGFTASTSATVTAAVLEKLEITAPASSVAKGRTVQLTATGTYSDGSKVALTNDASWVSSDGTILSVSNADGSHGLGTALSTGTVTITASYQGFTASLPMTVTAAVLTSLSVSPGSASVANGTTVQFSAFGTYSDGSTANLTTAVTWAASPSAVASITTSGTGAGLAKGLSVGTAAITASLSGVTSPAATLDVTAATLVSIALTPGSVSLVAGGTKTLVATGSYTDGTTQDVSASATWTSSATAVATVSNATGSKGLVTAVSAGTASITAAVGTVTSPAASVTVTAACKAIAINELMTGISGTAGAEFVELRSRCSGDVDLSGWKLVYRSAAGTTDTAVLTFNSGSSITASGFFTVATVPFTTTFPSYTIQQTWGSSSFSGSFSATGGAVQLRDASGGVIDSVGWGTATNAFVETSAAAAPTDAATPGKTIIRLPDGTDTDNNTSDFKVTTKPTPGTANILQ